MVAFRNLGWVVVAVLVAAAGCSGDSSSSNNDSGSGASGSGASGSGTNTTATSGSTNSTTATSGSGGTGSSIDCTAAHTNIPTGECSLLNQDCPAGQWCDIATQGQGGGAAAFTTACVTHMGGLKGKGDSCTDDSFCASGLLCIDSTCTPVCCPDDGSNEPCGGGTCNVNVTIGDSEAFIWVCSYAPSCELFTGECAGNTECHIEDPAGGLAVCSPPAPTQVDEGGSCMYVNTCKESQLCSNGVCRHLCDMNLPDTPPTPAGMGGCLMGRTCQDALNAAGFPNVGICLP